MQGFLVSTESCCRADHESASRMEIGRQLPEIWAKTSFYYISLLNRKQNGRVPIQIWHMSPFFDFRCFFSLNSVGECVWGRSHVFSASRVCLCVSYCPLSSMRMFLLWGSVWVIFLVFFRLSAAVARGGVRARVFPAEKTHLVCFTMTGNIENVSNLAGNWDDFTLRCATSPAPHR